MPEKDFSNLGLLAQGIRVECESFQDIMFCLITTFCQDRIPRTFKAGVDGFYLKKS